MPFQTNGKRDFKKELNWEKTSKPKRVKERASRNKARAIMVKEGKVSKFDGKDVDHKKPISKGGKTIKSNLRVQKASTNRSYARKANGSIK